MVHLHACRVHLHVGLIATASSTSNLTRTFGRLTGIMTGETRAWAPQAMPTMSSIIAPQKAALRVRGLRRRRRRRRRQPSDTWQAELTAATNGSQHAVTRVAWPPSLPPKPSHITGVPCVKLLHAACTNHYCRCAAAPTVGLARAPVSLLSAMRALPP